MTEAIVVALVTSVAPTLGALAAWRKANETNRAVGTPNGRGNVTQMLEFVCHRIERLETRVDRVEDRID